MFNLPSAIKTIDNLTHITLSSIWKEQVQESIVHDIETGIDDDDWDFVERKPFTEPFWGIVVNK